MRKSTICAVVFVALTQASPPLHAQSLLERSPNIHGGWTGATGVVHFNFLHRFIRGAAPENQVSNSPTFLLAVSPLRHTLAGVNYVTRSDLTPRFPNEWEIFARYAPLSSVSLQAGYNNAAESVDGEIGFTYDVGRVRLLAAARLLSNAFASDSTRFALAGGATLRVHRWVALAGDIATLADRADDEDVAWGAALQLAIPYTPHTLSLQAANTNTATLQGASRGTTRTRYGFEFTVPLTLSRWLGGGRATAAEAIPQGAVTVSMKQLQFTPAQLKIKRGTRVVWRNDDPLAHTVTAADGSWTSPLLQPGDTYSHTFESAGRFEITCTPHPFMKQIVEVD